MGQVNRGPIGIDLGTAYTRVGVFDGNHCKIIPDHNGAGEMPSYVAFTNYGILIGNDAKKQELRNPENTIFDIMHLIGRRYSDPSVQNDIKFWPFMVVADPNGNAMVEVTRKGKVLQFTPEEILSMVLTQIKKNAEANLGTILTDAVVAIPVCFNYEQRLAVRRAGSIAGLNIIQLINAPAAASLFYSLQRVSKSRREEYNMVVFDLGAGTLDVSVITLKGDVCLVRASAGNIYLSGNDINKNMVKYFINLVKTRDNKDLTEIPKALIKLRMASEKAKVYMSSGTAHVSVDIPSLYNDRDWKDFITKDKFDELNNDLFFSCIKIVDECLKDAEMNYSMVNEVILTGCSTRITSLQDHLCDYFKSKELINISEQLVMAATYGASIQAFFLSGRRDPRVIRSLSLKDVTSFSLGIRNSRGGMSVLIPKNTTIPTKSTKAYYLDQTSKFLVEIYEGEAKTARHNNFLGNFELNCRRRDIQNRYNFSINFEIGINGVLTVTGEEASTNVKNSITIAGDNSSLTKRISRKKKWEALLYKEESENGENKETTPPISSEISSPRKEKSGKAVGQSSKQNSEPKEYAIGIDFGTTYSSVGVWQKNGVKIIDNEYGKRLTNSCVAFTETGRLIGDSVSKEQVTTNPANAIYNVKRLIGRRYSDIKSQNDTQLLPYKVTSDNNRPVISVQYKGADKNFAPEEISAMVLTKMKDIAEAYLDSTVKNAVISVPACFSDSQRKAIKDAGIIAGLNVMQLINEPTAAAIAYFLQKAGGESFSEKNVLVFDLGGGILDVSVFTITGALIKVQAVAADTNLGGETFDDNLVNYFVQDFFKKNQKNKKDMSDKPRSLRRLRTACEKAKRVLSTVSLAMIDIDALYDGIDFHTPLKKEEFEIINASVFQRCIECVKKCLKDAKMGKEQIDDIILVGGSTRIPKVQEILQEFFDGKELCKSINQDEAIAYGASVQAAILSGNVDIKKFHGLEIQDVTSLSLGITTLAHGVESGAGAMNVIIPKSTPIPAEKDQTFTTSSDNQTVVSIDVHECELACMTDSNGLLAKFTLSGIPSEPRGSFIIPVVFEIDVNGILNLKSSNKESKIIISKNSCGLTEKEVEIMVKNAEVYKADDEEHKQRAAALNSLESWAYKMKEIARTGEDSKNKKIIDDAANKAITWLDVNQNAEIDEINKQIKTLQELPQKEIPEEVINDAPVSWNEVHN